MKFLLVIVFLALLASALARGIPRNDDERDGWVDVRARRIKVENYGLTDTQCTNPLNSFRTYANQCNNYFDGTSSIIFVNATTAYVQFFSNLNCNTIGTSPAGTSATLGVCQTITTPSTSAVVKIKTYGLNSPAPFK